MERNSEKIARLNDEFRKSIGQGDHVYMTPGIQALPRDDQFQVFNRIFRTPSPSIRDRLLPTK